MFFTFISIVLYIFVSILIIVVGLSLSPLSLPLLWTASGLVSYSSFVSPVFFALKEHLVSVKVTADFKSSVDI